MIYANDVLNVKGRGMCSPVCGMVHIKRTLAANWKE